MLGLESIKSDMTPDLTTITSVLAIGGVIFSIFLYFRTPTERLEKKQAVSDVAEAGRASALAQQVQWEKESNEKRFAEMGMRLDSSMSLAQNHLHTVDVKVDNLIETVRLMSNEITRLSTIIEERIPRKI